MKLHQHLFGNGKPLRCNAWAKPRRCAYIYNVRNIITSLNKMDKQITIDVLSTSLTSNVVTCVPMFVDDFSMFSHLTCRFVRPLQYLGTQGELWAYSHL